MTTPANFTGSYELLHARVDKLWERSRRAAID